jgi:hypothetical protein
MKTQTPYSERHHEQGMATLVFIVFLTIMVILMTANIRALIHLHRETQLLERQQIKRLAGPATNTVSSLPMNREKWVFITRDSYGLAPRSEPQKRHSLSTTDVISPLTLTLSPLGARELSAGDRQYLTIQSGSEVQRANFFWGNLTPES